MSCHGVNFRPDHDISDFNEQVILATGGNVSLGFETTKHLVKHPPPPIDLAARSAEKVEKAIQEIRQPGYVTTPIPYFPLDPLGP